MKKILSFILIILLFSSCNQIKKQDCMRFTRDIAGKCLRSKASTQMKIGISSFDQTASPSISIAEHMEDPSLHLIW